MNINVTTYIDGEKLLFEKNEGSFREEDKSYVINYFDKNKKSFEIVIDKNKDNVSILKEGVAMSLGSNPAETSYSTDFGIIKLKTKLLGLNILEKNKFIQFEINYKIFFSAIDSQNNILKILIKRF